jgi:hypothetical protein
LVGATLGEGIGAGVDVAAAIDAWGEGALVADGAAGAKEGEAAGVGSCGRGAAVAEGGVAGSVGALRVAGAAQLSANRPSNSRVAGRMFRDLIAILA